MPYIVNLNEVDLSHISTVGGKNASTGEMIKNLSKEGLLVPGGFATTVDAFHDFLKINKLDQRIEDITHKINYKNIASLNKASKQIQHAIKKAPLPKQLMTDVAHAYAKMSANTVAVRSSATMEDLEAASFAGMQETFLNVKGIKHILHAIKLVFASLYTPRAILYRHEKGFDGHGGLSAGIQPMIRSDKSVSGVMFSIDTESGFDKVVVISASYGLGEAIVQGSVNPDEFIVYKPALLNNQQAILQRKLGEKAIMMVYTQSNHPTKSIRKIAVPLKKRLTFCLSDDDIQTLARQAMIIEKHYGMPMDIEWAKDGVSGKLYILQARPETIISQRKNDQHIEHYRLSKKGKILTQGQSIGQHIGQGLGRIIVDIKQASKFQPGDVLVTDMTDPNWEPMMKKASAIVTNRGGRTCHAAIVARELGIPAVVGCENATRQIQEKEMVTVSCCEGLTGYVYAGKIPFSVDRVSVKNMPALPVEIMLNVGNPERAFSNQFLPNKGVGLARLEFIISNSIGIHPNAVLALNRLAKPLRDEIIKKTAAYSDPVKFYIEKLREGISTIAAAFYPKPVIFRFSDFKTNEYATLLGGRLFEPQEENPMLGFRGASRYYDKRFRDCFELECKAIKLVREKMGLTNTHVMVPFVRTVDELREVITLMKKFKLNRAENDLKIYMMCEIPSNVILADAFLQYVDGFSIGSNDLTQLTLGLDRDCSMVAALFDERNEAMKYMLHQAIEACLKNNKYIGICGQGPSDHPDFAQWLMEEQIHSMSLNPDTVVETWLTLAKNLDEKKMVV